jgi:beta-lactam-binding protein with PASTA domain
MEIEAGRVCGQQPRAGAQQSARLAVTLELARSTERGGVGTSSEWVKMPDVVGMPVDQATDVLEKAGFTKIVVQQRVDSECKPDVVCKQNPEPGSQGRLSLPKTLFVGAP